MIWVCIFTIDTRCINEKKKMFKESNNMHIYIDFVPFTMVLNYVDFHRNLLF